MHFTVISCAYMFQVECLHAIQAGDSNTRLQDAPAVQPTEQTASSPVVSQLSTASSVSAKKRCLSSSKNTVPECPDAGASQATCLGLVGDSSSAQANAAHQCDLLGQPATSTPQSPPQLSASSCVIHSPPAPLPGTSPFMVQSRASVPRLPSRLQQSSASLPQSSMPPPASPVKSCANALPAVPHCAGLASASVRLQAMLSAAMQSPKCLHPENPGYSASSSSTAAMHLSKPQSFSSSSGTQAHCTSATASQPLLAAGQATSVGLDWRLGQDSHVHGHCAMTAQTLSAGKPSAGTAARTSSCCTDMGNGFYQPCCLLRFLH